MTSTNLVNGSSRHIPKAAPTRALSPIRSTLAQTSPAPRMPSPRGSPALRPRSPLSPQLEAAARFDPLRPPSPRNMPPRAGNTSTLKLPSLPRFHPANFASTHSSLQTTPDAGQNSPQPPMSPRAHQRVISDAQKHLYAYQREILSANARASTPTQLDNPESPRLVPLGSPGPVTPLQLENESGDYLVGGVRGAAAANLPFQSQELVERLMKEEAARQWRASGRQSR